MTSGPITRALVAFRETNSSWLALPFFRDGSADVVAHAIDQRVASGALVLPAAENVFRALSLTPLERVSVVILGQDPYPTPGDAHGLAFSYVGTGRLPASLKVILAEVDNARPPFRNGDLTSWADQGVLLLNTALTVETGKAGAHLRLGWSKLADDVVRAVSLRPVPSVFLLWGAQARSRESLIDHTRHGIIAMGHPSPLNRARDFPGSRPFTKANDWLVAHGRPPIAWQLP